MGDLKETATKRLMQERKSWRGDHPFGFVAKPRIEGSETNMFLWDCMIPPKKNSDWFGPEGYSLELQFPENYPGEPPRCVFNPIIFHPNIFASGAVCLSILNSEKDYTPAISVKQILLGIQELLDTPNIKDPAQREAYQMLKDSPEKYSAQVKTLAKIYKPRAKPQ